MSKEAQGRLMDNIAAAMQGVPAAILERQIAHFLRCDPDYGRGVAARVGLAESIPASVAAE
jgi:catalase